MTSFIVMSSVLHQETCMVSQVSPKGHFKETDQSVRKKMPHPVSDFCYEAMISGS